MLVQHQISFGERVMKAVRIHQFGGPEVLTYEDIPDPQPRKDQVLVRVRACSLNHLDVWVRKGLPGVKLPHILGSDVAGEVVEVGEYVGGFKAGQRVCWRPCISADTVPNASRECKTSAANSPCWAMPWTEETAS